VSELRAAIVQDAETRQVLMLGWMDEEAERLTRETGEVHFYSRSRKRLNMAGENASSAPSTANSAKTSVTAAIDLQPKPGLFPT